MSYDELPGGLGRWRARWLVARHSGALGPLAYGGVLVLLAPVILFAPVMLLWFALQALYELGAARWGNRGGVPVTADTHPELTALVEEVARRVGVAPPDRVLLTADPVVTVEVVGGRRFLCVGLPLLACLDRPELRAVVAHRLALLRYRPARLVDSLFELWAEATDTIEIETAVAAQTTEDRTAVAAETTGLDSAVATGTTEGRGAASTEGGSGATDGDGSYRAGRRLRRAEALRRELDAFAAVLHRDADAAAVDAAGGTRPAALAFARSSLVPDEYDRLHDGVPRRSALRSGVGIRDLDEGWRRLLRHGIGPSDWDDDTAALQARHHPALAAALRELGAEAVVLMPAADPVPTAPLTPRQQRRIVRRLVGVPYPQYLGWTTWADAPPAWWRRRAAEDADAFRGHVTTLLGRRPVDDVEVGEVIRDRSAELLAIALDVPPSAVESVPYDEDDPPTALIRLVEANLLGSGWRLEHPAVRDVLVGPDGTRVDARRLVLDSRGDLATLRPHLTPTARQANGGGSRGPG
ncbi:M48 family metallopeptidase [Micromonospora sp. NPDC000207]|uniref:M48 family metallopeptidase n=1 Tax=Micromonospora sp. NPDC000207 TaxID=3154246 RepID=UPI003319B756